MKRTKSDGSPRQRRRATNAELETLRTDAESWRRFVAMVQDTYKYRYGADRPTTELVQNHLRRTGAAVIEGDRRLRAQGVSGVPQGALWRAYKMAWPDPFLQQMLEEDEATAHARQARRGLEPVCMVPGCGCTGGPHP